MTSNASPPVDPSLVDLRAIRDQDGGDVLRATEDQLQRYASDLRRAYAVMRELVKDLEDAYYDTVVRLLRAARFKDEETGAHLVRISHYCRGVASHLGLSAEETARIAAAAPLHDVGKIAIPDAILGKKGPLEKDEWEKMKTHAGVGASLLKGSRSALMECASDIALTHHERWSGGGYPRGLKGEEIPLPGRIVIMADQYDALRSRRCYKPEFSHEKTFDIITKGDGRTNPGDFAPDILAVFKDIHEEFDRIFSAHNDEADPDADEV